MELNEIYKIGMNTHKIYDKSIEDYDFEEELASTEMLNSLEDLYSMEVMEKIHQKNTSDLLKMCNRISNDFANKIGNESVSKSIESYCKRYSMEAENDQPNQNDNTQPNNQNTQNDNTNNQPNQNNNNPNNQPNDNNKEGFIKKMVEILKKLGNAIVNFVQTIFKKIQDFLFDHFNKTPPKDVSTDAIRKVLPKDEKLLFIIKNSGAFRDIGTIDEVSKFAEFGAQNKDHPEKIKDSNEYKAFLAKANKLFGNLDEKISDEKVIQILDKFTGNKLGTIKDSGVIEFASKASNLENASETIKKHKELVNGCTKINKIMSVVINVGGAVHKDQKETLNCFKDVCKYMQNDLRCINEYIKSFRNSYRLNVEAQKAMNNNSNNNKNQNNNKEQTPIENK